MHEVEEEEEAGEVGKEEVQVQKEEVSKNSKNIFTCFAAASQSTM